jgi:hypothetical protein
MAAAKERRLKGRPKLLHQKPEEGLDETHAKPNHGYVPH